MKFMEYLSKQFTVSFFIVWIFLSGSLVNNSLTFLDNLKIVLLNVLVLIILILGINFLVWKAEKDAKDEKKVQEKKK